jgi:hypothetical protein
MFSFSIAIPTNKMYLDKLYVEPNYSGFIMAFTPIGTLISLFYTTKWIETSYKNPLLLSTLFCLLGNLSYALGNPLQNVFFLGLGRFLIGLGSGRVVNRNYLINFVPKKKLSMYLTYFQLATLTGLASGPLCAIFLLLIKEEGEYFNHFTNPAWFCLLFSIVLLLYILVVYTEPLQTNFTIYNEDVSSSGRENSFISRESLSRKEVFMIDQIDDKLSEINERNKFSDTNLVARNIEQIAWKERKTTSYIYKCFIVFISILIVVRVSLII